MKLPIKPIAIALILLQGGLAMAASASASFSSIFSFSGQPGAASPAWGAQLTNVGGALYGVTTQGGKYNLGTLYKMDPASNQVTVLHNFGGAGDGTYPASRLLYLNGKLYGATGGGGTTNNGTVYSIDLKSGAETIVYSFAGGSNDGNNPTGPLVYVNGALYGNTTAGGAGPGMPFAPGSGVVFKIDLATGTETVLHSFMDGMDGAFPRSGLLLSNGKIYGTTPMGGAFGGGIIFEVDPATDITSTIFSFDNAVVSPSGTCPSSTMIAHQGKLYGTTSCNFGGIFEFDPATGVETALHIFSGAAEGSNDSLSFEASLLYYQGSLYGVNAYGGLSPAPDGYGTVYAYSLKRHRLSVIHTFTGADGADPDAGLTNVNGLFYGVTSIGGSGNLGTLYTIAP